MLRRFLIISMLLLPTTAFAATEKSAKPSPLYTEAERQLGLVDPATVKMPVKPDGFPDYVAWFDTLQRTGVTAENNAFIHELRAMGLPDETPKEKRIREILLHRLKMDLPADGVYFIEISDYQKQWIGNAIRRGVSDEEIAAFRKLDDWALADQRDDALTRPWTARELPHVAAWLKRNDEPLAHMIAASKCSRSYVPLVWERDVAAPMYNEAEPSLIPYQLAARALLVRAMLRAESNDFGAMQRDLVAAARLGRLVSQRGYDLSCLASIAVGTMASKAVQSLVRHRVLTADQLRLLQRDLHQLPPRVGHSRSVNTYERALAMAVLDLYERGFNEAGKSVQPPPPPILNFATARRTVNQLLDERSLAASEPDHTRMLERCAAVDKKSETIVRKGREVIKQHATGGGAPEALLRIIFENHGPGRAAMVSDVVLCYAVFYVRQPLAPAVNAIFEARAVERLTQLAMALERHRLRHRTYPRSLSDIMKLVEAEDMVDPFTGDEMLYRRSGDGYVLYSVGRDLEDNKGVFREEREDSEDNYDVGIRIGN